MSDRTSVYAMVHQVLADSKTKLASGQVKTASQNTQVSSAASHKVGGSSASEFHKIADACERLSRVIHLVNDTRSPKEKLAEYKAYHAALTKRAFEVGHEAPKDPQAEAAAAGYAEEAFEGPHQTEEADADSIPPTSPPMDDGAPDPGGPDSAMLAMPSTTPGESLDAGESGEATPANLPPDYVEPDEKAQEFDAPNALETNKDMMMPEQPETVLKQAAARKIAYMRKLADLSHGNILQIRDTEAATPSEARGEAYGRRLGAGTGMALGGLGGAAMGVAGPLAAKAILRALHADGRIAPELLEKFPAKTLAALGLLGGGVSGMGIGGALGRSLGGSMGLSSGAALGDEPEFRKNAQAMKLAHMRKLAEDALYPAQISAGSAPVLQSVPGVPDQLSQGSEAGDLTPRETAPNVGEGSGRELLSSVEAAINATKEKAKRQNKGPLAELLTEPAMSEEHDRTLNESLDNTDAAGVKISSAQVNAARELLRRYVDASPANRMKLAQILKLSEEGVDTADIAPGGGGSSMPNGGEMVTPPETEEDASMDEGDAGVSEDALQAAASGVTPEELEQAQQLLAMEEAGVEEAPEAGEEDKEVTTQMGGMGTSTQPTSSPWGSGGGM